MPASITPPAITLANLSWSTPDGRSVLSDISLGFGLERTGLVGRNGTGKSSLLKLMTGALRPQSGTVSVRGSLGILNQNLLVRPDDTVAGLFGATAMLDLLRRAERGDADADALAEVDWTLEGRIRSALGRVGLEAEPETPLTRLSGGQRTRAALAAAIFPEPDVLLLDEPTNDLDREGREAVIGLLASWRAGAVVVSHDRDLLDRMDAIVELTTLGATRYGGNWSHYRAARAQALDAARHDLADAEKRVAEAARTAQATAERKARKDRAGQRKAAKGDLPRILLGGRKERSEATGGDNARRASQQKADALDAVAAARARIEILQPLSVVLPPTGLPPGRTVLTLDGVSAGYEAGRPVVRDLSFTITGPERVAVTGPNGSGKTTLLTLVAGHRAPWSGTVRVVAGAVMLDQRVSLLDPSETILDNFRRLNPQAGENACRASLARFMFRADAALQRVSTLSGGQTLRAGLACVLGGAVPPPLLILDEPTNHLDIESIEAVEAGLRAYDGALLVVSHDEAFLDAIGITRRLDLTNRSGSGPSAGG
ncbi:ABC transporter ATP-binding protein [Azospirillum brasilense]|uniref:ABC transporter ATP-binding protein n=1 Tax=Azospirillum brasilense TaxID=192 RepID=A0A4D8QXY9_AZOBR|nr:ABC-F family ATP-binding cassette domain-containing protein [Azospirillum brasilense]QCO15147.1 ABC transporter ATP-binding protein [Azospirillum brasilense]